MKAVRVTADQDRTLNIAPLPLPAAHRTGEASAERYRQQSKGQLPRGSSFNPLPSDFLRAIVLSDGKFQGLASQPGSLLSFVISGDVTLIAGPSQTCQLGPGDILLTDERSSPCVTLDVRNQGRLLQIGVTTDWPGPEAEIQAPGTINPRRQPTPNIKRVYTGEDDKAYITEFAELFPNATNQWSTPRRITGFRMLGWEDRSGICGAKPRLPALFPTDRETPHFSRRFSLHLPSVYLDLATRSKRDLGFAGVVTSVKAVRDQ